MMENQATMSGVTAAGPEAAYLTRFAETYKQYYTRVFAYIYNRVSNVELAKDLTAEVFVKAFEKGRSVRRAEAYGSWLFMVARNVVVGHFRRCQRNNNRLARLRASFSPASDEELLAGVTRGEEVSRLMQEVRQLSAREQELLSLKFDAELTNAEIGRVMRMSEVNVRVSIFRALNKLRERMKEELGESQ